MGGAARVQRPAGLAGVRRATRARGGAGVAQDPAAMSEFLKGRRQLSPGDVTAMEQYLTANPQDIEVRSQLILYYYANGVREPRIGHILWLVANHPESDAAVFTSQGVLPRDTYLNTAAEYQRVLAAWKQAVATRQGRTPRCSATAPAFSSPPATLRRPRSSLDARPRALAAGAPAQWKRPARKAVRGRACSAPPGIRSSPIPSPISPTACARSCPPPRTGYLLFLGRERADIRRAASATGSATSPRRLESRRAPAAHAPPSTSATSCWRARRGAAGARFAITMGHAIAGGVPGDRRWRAGGIVGSVRVVAAFPAACPAV